MRGGSGIDDQVVAAASNGEEWAWARLHAAVAPGVRGYVAGAGATDPDAVLGEAFARLARDLGGCEATADEARLWTYLHARAVLHERRELAVDEGRTRVEGVPPLVMVALATLKPIEREALLLRVTGGLDDDDVATVIGQTPEAVRRHLHSALRSLQAAMA